MESLDIVVIDGRSTDGTQEIVKTLGQRYSVIRLIDNPRITQAAGWNLGIDEARGDIVGIVSGHAQLDFSYVSTAVETLQRTTAGMVGGVTRGTGANRLGRAVALALSSRFGVGDSRSHYATREQQVDTVFMGVCWRETYKRFRFDEEMIRNQDDELSYRMLDAGCTIICNPAIKSWYFNRSTLRGLFEQYYSYGFWKVRVAQKHPRQTRIRHLIPAVVVATGVGVAALTPILVPARVAFLALGALYSAAAGAAAIRASSRTDLRLTPLVAICFSLMHLGYGLGFLRGLLHFRGRPYQRPE
jgi:succinoglycan biosynthesis protein ExoA